MDENIPLAVIAAGEPKATITVPNNLTANLIHCGWIRSHHSFVLHMSVRNIISTLADQVGACTAVLKPLHGLIEAHVLAAERLHADDTTVPILAKGKTVTGHIWTYVRDDRPFGGRAPPAALYYASRDRRHEHPERHLAGFAQHPAGRRV
jgi:hypothetical protein